MRSSQPHSPQSTRPARPVRVSHRIAQVNELVREELNPLLLTEAEFPRQCMVTIVRVETSKDLRHATVWLSVMPMMYAGKVVESLRQTAGRIQFQLNRRLTMRPLPRLQFRIDDTERRAADIENVLKTIRTTEE